MMMGNLQGPVSYTHLFQMIKNRIDVQLGLVSQKLTFIYVKDLAKLILKACLSDKVHKGYFATDGNVYTSEALSLIHI